MCTKKQIKHVELMVQASLLQARTSSHRCCCLLAGYRIQTGSCNRQPKSGPQKIKGRQPSSSSSSSSSSTKRTPSNATIKASEWNRRMNIINLLPLSENIADLWDALARSCCVLHKPSACCNWLQDMSACHGVAGQTHHLQRRLVAHLLLQHELRWRCRQLPDRRWCSYVSHFNRSALCRW